MRSVRCSPRSSPMPASTSWTRLAVQALCGSSQACIDLLRYSLSPFPPPVCLASGGFLLLSEDAKPIFSPVTQHKKAAFRAKQHKKRLFIVLFQEQRALWMLIPAGPLRSPGCARRSGLLCTESIRATFDCLITVYHISEFIASTILFYKCTFNFCSLSLSYLGLFM